MHRVAILLYPEALATSVTLPAEILNAAAQMSRSSARPARPLSVQLLRAIASSAARPGAAHTLTLSAGLRMQVDGCFDQLQHCDLLILPAIWRHPRRVQRQCAACLPRIRRLYAQGAELCSVGTASHLLAAAGLLEGRPATTHWHDFQRFASAYPDVELKRRHLVTHSERIYCAGSVNSIADVMVHKVGQWYGARIARAIEAQFSPEARQPLDTAAFLAQSRGAHPDAAIREIQDYLQQNPGAAHSNSALAAMTGLSTRSFTRRFRQATGESPMRYLARLRIGEARALLQHTDLAVADIGWRSGFGSPSRFAQAFRQVTRLSPREYRAAVRGKRFGDSSALERAAQTAPEAA